MIRLRIGIIGLNKKNQKSNLWLTAPKGATPIGLNCDSKLTSKATENNKTCEFAIIAPFKSPMAKKDINSTECRFEINQNKIMELHMAIMKHKQE